MTAPDQGAPARARLGLKPLRPEFEPETLSQVPRCDPETEDIVPSAPRLAGQSGERAGLG